MCPDVVKGETKGHNQWLLAALVHLVQAILQNDTTVSVEREHWPWSFRATKSARYIPFSLVIVCIFLDEVLQF